MSNRSNRNEGEKLTEKAELICGLIMPISAIDGCSADHWAEVKRIIEESIESISNPRFRVRLVSDADDVGVIQKRIVQNVYNADVVICDVSGKNPNVMFELGMRLAFDKPAVIIKDDKTDYSFDTGIIEHVGYPRDLHYHQMVSFKSILVQKVISTHLAATSDNGHSTFLKNFGTFQVAKLSEGAVPVSEFVTEAIDGIYAEMSRLRSAVDKISFGHLVQPVFVASEAKSKIQNIVADYVKRFPERSPENDFQARIDILNLVLKATPEVRSLPRSDIEKLINMAFRESVFS